MFVNLRITIFLYYFITVVLFLVLSYYFLITLHIENIYFFALIAICFIILSGGFISKLAVTPLAEYIEDLQNLSQETLHELNLPISTIVTNSQMLSKNLQNEKDIKRLARINSACIMLQERYNELDYMIKMQSREDLKENFFLDVLIQERVKFLSKIYPQIDFDLTLDILEIRSDKKGLQKVIDNLIDNGVKYSPYSKKIDIMIQNNHLIIKDYGLGMDETEIVQIFDNYYQSDKRIKGFGIGLSMIKRFCDKNDIELHFQSEVNIGTEIKLKFKNI